MNNLFYKITLGIFSLFLITSFATTDTEEGINKKKKYSQPTHNPWLSADKMATTHFDMGQTDNFEAPIIGGEFNIDPLDSTHVQRVTAGPVNIITLKSTSKDFWWALSTDKISYIDGRNGQWLKIAEYQLPKVAPISNENLDALLSKKYSSSEALAKDYDQLWAPSKELNPTVRMLTGNSIYAFVDKDGYLYLTASGYIYKLAFDKDKVTLVNKINVKERMAVPEEMKKFIDLNQIPGGITGAQISYDGTIIVGTIFGLMAIDRDLKEIKDNLALPIESFYTSYPPDRRETPEFISNSFAIDENNAVYVASGTTMNKIVWNGKLFSMEAKDGAWSEKYQTGDLSPTIKYGTGTGSTPTLMGFGKDEDKLVVITDGENRMHLTAFWRDRQDNEQQLADKIEVNCGYGDTPPAFIQSEQSVATLGYGAFVVNNIAPQKEGLRDFDPTHKVNDLIFNVLAVGPVVQAGKGIERFEWNTKTNKWKRVWANSDIASTSMVPAVSSTSNVVCINTYDDEKGWQVLGLDWTTGEPVQIVNFGKSSFGNGAYALIQYDENGDLIFNSIGGSMRVSITD